MLGVRLSMMAELAIQHLVRDRPTIVSDPACGSNMEAPTGAMLESEALHSRLFQGEHLGRPLASEPCPLRLFALFRFRGTMYLGHPSLIVVSFVRSRLVCESISARGRSNPVSASIARVYKSSIRTPGELGTFPIGKLEGKTAPSPLHPSSQGTA